MRKTICLNMIVKNESHIILKTLANILQYIPLDYWVISDTGSTDNTPDVIKKFFKERNIPGELLHHAWKDFGYNRTVAIECAYKKTDFIFIFDADDTIHGEFKMPDLNHEWYLLEFGDKFKYVRPLLFTNHKKWKYTGVLHEYLEPLEPMTAACVLKGNYYIESGRLGDRSKKTDKYYHDAILLENAFETEQNSKLKDRYAFYCAQSYRDAGEAYMDKSIEWYDKIINNKDQWDQEKYYSALQLGILYYKKQVQDKSLYYLLKTVEYDIERIEGIVLAMQLYSQTGNHILVNALYHKFKHYKLVENKLFIELSSYKHRIEFFNSISAFFVNDSKEGYDCCKKILFGGQLPLSDVTLTLQNIMTGYRNFLMEDDNTLELFIYISALQEWNIHNIQLWNILFTRNKEKFTELPSTSISKLKAKQNSNTSILISFYCNDVPTFKNTLHSILRSCAELTIIPHWMCVCSPKIDMHKLKKTYSWIEFYKEDAFPLNMIWDKLHTLKPIYWMHIPDCIFYHPFEIKPFLNILSKSSLPIKQIILNRNYGTVPNHIHEENNIGIPNISLHHYNPDREISSTTYEYWPHYAVQPSICLVHPILQLGKYPTTPSFEYEYAKKWTSANYKTAFYTKNTFYIPETVPRQIMVPTVCTHPHICIVNLERRLDRKQKLQSILNTQHIYPQWIKAVDGKQLTPTDEIKKLIEGNTYNNRRGVIGCALSHLNIWKQLVHDSQHDYYVVLEDDITIYNDAWYDKINAIQRGDEELIWLGYSMYSAVRKTVNHIYDVSSNDFSTAPFQSSNYIGGTFGYMIYKSGAQKLIQYIQGNGIKSPIDNLMVSVPGLVMKELRPFLFHSEWFESIGKPVDSDIQNINDNLFSPVNLNLLLDQFIFVPNMDQIGNDLYRYSATIEEQLIKALNDEKCIAFNTLGYFKYDIKHLNNSTAFTEKDGIFLKKTRFKVVQNPKSNQ